MRVYSWQEEGSDVHATMGGRGQEVEGLIRGQRGCWATSIDGENNGKEHEKRAVMQEVDLPIMMKFCKILYDHMSRGKVKQYDVDQRAI